MRAIAIGMLAVLAVTLPACGKKPEADATNNLQEATENASTQLSAIADNMQNPALANMVVNQSVELTNANDALDNAQAHHK